MAFVPDKDRIALGIKQPWAELILRGLKTLEIRSRPTKLRGPIYLYTSRRVAQEEFAEDACSRFGLDPAKLVTGLIVGSVEIIDCRPTNAADASAACVPAQILSGHYAWVLSQPQRLDEPQPVRFLPYGVWFYPYRRRNG